MDSDTILNTLYAKNIIQSVDFILTTIENNMYIINTIFNNNLFFCESNLYLTLSIDNNVTIIDTKGNCVYFVKPEKNNIINNNNVNNNSFNDNSTNNNSTNNYVQQSDMHLW
jgi:hypothetical protein